MTLVEKIISGVNSLPTLPTVYSALSEAVDNPLTSSEELAKLIASDQASAFKILKVINSPFYGFRRRIDTISQAILYLGYNEVRNVISALSVINFFSKDRLILNFNPIDFWAHSIGVGITTRIIGTAIGERNIENYFLAGIIHDIGKLVFFEFAPDDYKNVLEIVESENCFIKDAEIKVFGIDHTVVGQMLAEKWKLPQSIQDTIRQHHNGVVHSGEPNKLVAAVHIGDITARMLELGNPGDSLIPEPSNKAWESLSIPKGFFCLMRKKINEDFTQTVRLMLAE